MAALPDRRADGFRTVTISVFGAASRDRGVYVWRPIASLTPTVLRGIVRETRIGLYSSRNVLRWPSSAPHPTRAEQLQPPCYFPSTRAMIFTMSGSECSSESRTLEGFLSDADDGKVRLRRRKSTVQTTEKSRWLGDKTLPGDWIRSHVWRGTSDHRTTELKSGANAARLH